MSTLRIAAIVASLALGLSAGVFAAESQNNLRPNLGQPITPGDLAPWDITIFPDGTGLPAGSGTAKQGAPIFQAKCSACHGENGKGGEAAMVTAGPPRATLDGGKTI